MNVRVRRGPVVYVMSVLCAGAGGGLTVVLYTQGLEVAAAWAQLLSLALAVLPIMVWRRSGGGVPAASTPAQVDQAQRALAMLVLRQWRDEIVLRQLDDPAPLAVQWRLTEIDSGEEVGRAFRVGLLRSLLRQGRRRFEGRTDRMEAMVGEFRSLAHRRLVILGEPGMGKTTLAVLLLRELLRSHGAGDPVPVLISLSGWRPAEQPLHEWLARRLAMDYPALRAADFGLDAPQTLVADRRILPVLDGLDEMPVSVRPEAIAALNAASTKDDQLILTCRTAEYEAACNVGSGIRGAAVIEPMPIRTKDIIAYLKSCLTTQHIHRDKWHDLFRALIIDRAGPLTGALRTPLDLWLVRRIHIDAPNDPAVLVDRHRFPTSDRITNYLLDHLTAALISTASRRGDHMPNSLRPEQAWQPDDAQRWLSFLAHHLHHTGSKDLAWWHLRGAVRLRAVHRTAVGIVLALFLGPLTGALGWMTGTYVGEPVAATGSGLVGGSMIGLAFGLGADPTAEPAHADLRLSSGRIIPLLRELGYRMATCLIIGLMAGTAMTLVGVPIGGIAEISILALAFGFVYGLMVWVATPVTNYQTQSPASTLRNDLQLALVRTVVFASAGGVLAGLLAGLTGEHAIAVMFVLTSAFTFVLIVGSPPKVASSVYLATAFILFLRHRTPLRLMRFLGDAHRLGLLRQTGPVYQFRHAKLQNRLAQNHQHRTQTPHQHRERA